MKPLSTDFRQKIVETKYKTNQSLKQIANRFQVSYSFVQKLLKRYAETGSVKSAFYLLLAEDPHFSEGMNASQDLSGKTIICSTILCSGKAHEIFRGLASLTSDRRDKYRPRNCNGELARSWGFPP